jgi:outer membrane lipoprotein-sorting protein
MKKKIIAVCLVVVLILVAVFKILFDNKDPNKTLNEVKDNLTSYYMEGRMTLYNGEDKREFDVKVSYDYKDEVDFFKVSLFDLGINQEQIIIKNLDGVYVISPSLNKVYKFNGSWPMNSPKPYIYQSMIDLKEGEYELKEVDGCYLVKSKPNFDNKIQWGTQEVMFTKDYIPKYLNIYDDNNNLSLTFNVNKMEINKEFNDNYFKVDDNLIEARESSTYTYGVSEEELPFLPINSEVESVLKESSTYVINDETYYILTYEGSKPFTLVQRLLKDNEDVDTSIVDGKLVDLINGVGIYHDGVLTYCYNSVEYNIYSEVLTLDEMIELANGVEVSYAK